MAFTLVHKKILSIYIQPKISYTHVKHTFFSACERWPVLAHMCRLSDASDSVAPLATDQNHYRRLQMDHHFDWENSHAWFMHIWSHEFTDGSVFSVSARQCVSERLFLFFRSLLSLSYEVCGVCDVRGAHPYALFQVLYAHITIVGTFHWLLFLYWTNSLIWLRLCTFIRPLWGFSSENLLCYC